jgi:hypothetical protein
MTSFWGWFCFFGAVFSFGWYVGFEIGRAKIADLERIIKGKDDEIEMLEARFARERLVDSISNTDLIGRVINTGRVDGTD